MDRALVVVEATESAESLLREASELASGAGAELVLCGIGTAEEAAENREVLETIAHVEGTDVSEEAVEESIRSETERIAREVLGERPEGSTVVGVITDDAAIGILDVAEEYDCDHVFVAGRKRSPTGKVLFGDRTQEVLLNFEGLVTVALA